MKLKEWLEKIGIGVATSLIVLVLTAVIKGESLNGLLKISGLFQFLKTGVPLWLFLISLIAGLLGSLQWIRHVISKQAVLRVIWRPEVCLWGTGTSGNKPMMQVITSGYFTNTDKEHKLLIMSAYLEGTKPVLGFMEPIEIGPEECAQERIDAYVEPVVGKKGERYKGKIILADQFGRKHKFSIELGCA